MRSPSGILTHSGAFNPAIPISRMPGLAVLEGNGVMEGNGVKPAFLRFFDMLTGYLMGDRGLGAVEFNPAFIVVEKAARLGVRLAIRVA